MPSIASADQARYQIMETRSNPNRRRAHFSIALLIFCAI
jgi:hypothetical protein